MRIKVPPKTIGNFKVGHLKHVQISYNRGGGGVGLTFIPPPSHYEKPLYLKWFVSLQWSNPLPSDRQTYGWLKVSN